ncbi:MAG TPA: glycosyltransferase family 1 protein [Candidatus Saccharimonadia bacterium]|nr:glycosyltransferase family 1 protein [Candidatus Saccharimonadia bacterium]
MNQKTFWIDLTDLYLWEGHHTGIQRTVYNYAKYYADRGDAKFFIFSEKQSEFYELDFQAIKVPAKRVRRSLRRSELRDDILYKVKTTYSILPFSWRKRISPVLKPVARQALNKTHHTIYLTKRAFTTPAQQKPQKRAAFKAGDAVIVLGAGWIRPTIVTELWYRKQTDGFKIFHFIHDMIPTYQPHLFGPGHFELATRYMFEAISASDGLITNSESSKRDTARFMQDLNIPERPISVVRLGDELKHLAEPAAPTAPIEPGSYILTVATLEVRKNHILLYNAYKLAKARGDQMPRLVLVGRPGWNAGDVLYAMKHDPEVRDMIVLLKDTDDAELVWLLQNCKMAVYPATYEGWGLPHAEALVMGKVSLTSNTSSLPEVAGDIVDYFDPFDASDCLAVITKYLDPDVLALTERRIASEYKTQSWRSSYEQLDRAITTQLESLQ